MLSKLEFHATLPVKDLNRARTFYQEKLGMTPQTEGPGGLIYQSKDSWFLLFPSSGSASGEYTQGGWTTDDINAEVAELKSRGVVFEEYDFPGLKTVNGIAKNNDGWAAWFKDSEGNLLGLVQLP